MSFLCTLSLFPTFMHFTDVLQISSTSSKAFVQRVSVPCELGMLVKLAPLRVTPAKIKSAKYVSFLHRLNYRRKRRACQIKKRTTQI